MADIATYPLIRHLMSETTNLVLHHRRGRLRRLPQPLGQHLQRRIDHRLIEARPVGRQSGHGLL